MIDFREEVRKALKKEMGNILKEIPLETPKQQSFGDIAFPCFLLAKQYKKNPAEIAKDLEQKIKLQKNEYIIDCEAQGPYVNFFFNKELFAEQVLKVMRSQKQEYGKGKKKKEQLMVEYCQINTHKAFHVGHLRGTLIGAALVNLLRFEGYNVLGVNYQGDIGAHVAKVMWYVTKHNKDHMPKEHKGKWIGKIYQKANALLAEGSAEQQEQYKREVSEVLQKLEQGDKRLLKIWKETRQWCLDDFDQFYKEIGVSFDKFFFESQMEKPGKDIVQKLLKKGIAQISEGAIIIDLKNDDLGIFLLLKSDGTALYATKDLALAEKKFKEFKITKSIYVVGSEQKLYFQQLFKTLELMGFKHAKECVHIPYELVTLEGGKISSREGELMYAEDLVDMLKKEAYQGVESRHKEWPEKEKQKAATSIALGALKYSFLNVDNHREINFDQEKALAFEGDTGPYIQYAHARICSILKKTKIPKSGNSKVLRHSSEQGLIKLLAEYPDLLEKAAQDLKLNLLTMYAYQLAKSFNEFYRDCPILKEKDDLKNARLSLILAVKEVLQSSLAILGIDAPEQM